jgi:metal-sulfur cluster biosynthetic enzyme/Fe-S cluster assembly iron-binding protein IscA
MSTPPASPAAAGAASIRLKLTAPAREALQGALHGRPPGSGVRVWVERGMHPHAQMMLDRPSVRDVPLTLEGVPLLIDEASVPFLRDAEIRYRTDVDPPGFEVVGPFLPAKSAPPAPTGPGPAPTEAPAPSASPEHTTAEERVRTALKSIYDPEIPMNIVDLGLLYGFDWGADGALTIRMTMTSPGCPAVEELVHEVEKAAQAASGAPSVKVAIVWEPPWGPERMTDFARRQFGYA